MLWKIETKFRDGSVLAIIFCIVFFGCTSNNSDKKSSAKLLSTQLLISDFHKSVDSTCCKNFTEFTQPQGDYTFKINELARYRSTPIKGGYVEIFTVLREDQKRGDYLISVAKVGGVEDDILEGKGKEVFKESFLQTCNCEVTEELTKQYDHFESLVYNLKFTKMSGDMIGESAHILANGSMYSVTYMVQRITYERFKPEFDYTLNTMVIR